MSGSESEGGESAIRVNGQRQALAVERLADLLTGMGYELGATGIAVAVNGEVVPRTAWRSTRLRAGDAVEIVGAVQGG